LLSLLPGLAVILLAMRTPTRYWNKILIAILICAFVSAALGILQVAAGADSGIYLYQVTNRGSAVGLFANRNHQALLLAISFPCLALWAVTPPRQSRTVTIRNWFALLGSFSLLLVVLIVGSRAGLILAALGAASALILIRTSGYRLSFGSSRLTRITMYSVLAFLGLVLGSIALFSSRSETVERLGRGLFLEDQRITATPIVLRIWTDFFPTGAGFGSFDPVFRTYEPVSMLGPQYFNHAHNDLLEVGLEGGLPAYIVLALILGWTAWKSFKVWRERQPTRPILYGRLASIVIVLMLIASLVDYPLRTPVMSGLFALMLVWLAFDRSQAARLRTATAGKGP
jgi:O-antigen ligase